MAGNGFNAIRYALKNRDRNLSTFEYRSNVATD